MPDDPPTSAGSPPPPPSPENRPGKGGTNYEEETSFAPPLRSSVVRSVLSDSDPVPKSIGKYRVLQKLGEGGMGMVLLAIREGDNFKQRVAIKVVKRGLDTADIVRRFELERQVLSALNHPNIAQVREGGTTEDGRPYFVMEYVEGQTIDEYCDSNQLSIEERLCLFQKVCSAVHYAHQNLVVHRDLKPGNIIVTKEGEPKLLDFGIAKLLNPELMFSGVVTGPEIRLMTPEYSSPEQVKGEPITTASDVYSLGVLLYELLTGRRPYHFKRRLHDEIVRIISEVEPERPSTAITKVEETVTRTGETVSVTPESVAKTRDALPAKLRRRLAGDLDNIVLMALRKTPRRRYASAADLAADIQRHLDGLPVRARAETFSYVAAKFVRRNRGAVLAAAAMLLLAFAGTAGIVWQYGERAKQQELASKRLEVMREWAGKTLKETDARIRKLAGATEAKMVLGEMAVTTIQALLEDFPDDPELLRHQAEAKQLLAAAQATPTGSNAGDVASAQANLEDAIKSLRELASKPTSTVSDKLKLAVALREGYANLSQKDRAAAKTYIDEARKVVSALHSPASPDPEVENVLAVVLLDSAEAVECEGRLDEAASLLEQSQAIRDKYAALPAQNVNPKRAQSSGYLRLAMVELERGNADAAVTRCREAVRIRETVLAAEKNGRAERDVAIAQWYLVRALLKQREPDLKEIDDLLRRQAETYVRLRDADPSNARAVKDFARGLTQQGNALLARGDFDTAINRFTEAKTVLGEHKGEQDRASLLAEAMAGLARAQSGKGLTTEARASFESALWLYGMMTPCKSERKEMDRIREAMTALAKAP